MSDKLSLSEGTPEATVPAVPPPSIGMASGEPIGNRALTGAAWSIGANLAAKVFTAVGQFALVWYLAPDDFAVMGIAFGITGIAVLLSDTGLRQLLIQQAGDETEILSHGFWAALTLNGVAAAVLAASGPVAARYYGRDDYVLVMGLMASTLVLQTFQIAASAKLYRALRFPAIALGRFTEGVTYTGGAILLAYLGWGPLALIVPHVARNLVSVVLLNLLAGGMTLRAPNGARVAEMLRGTVWLNFNAMLNALQGSGANLVLGALTTETVTGLFIWGYAVAAQVVFVLARNLQNVFFPALARLRDDPARQYEGFCKGLRMLLAVVAPLCVLQAMLAGPLLEIAAPGRWSGAGQVIFWVSLGLTCEPVYVLASALLLAQGRFRWVAGRTGIMVALLFSAAALAAESDDAERIAQAVGAALAVGALLAGRLAVGSTGKGWSELLRLVAPPLASTALAGWAAFGVQSALERAHPWAALAASAATMAAAFVLLALLLMKADVKDMRTRVRNALQQRNRKA